MAFCLCRKDNTQSNGKVDTRWVISELRDIINTGFNGMRTICRLTKLNLPDDVDGLDDGDVMTGLKRHLKIQEKLMEKINVDMKVPYEPEVNNYVNTNCGLNVTANNALIVGKVILKLFHYLAE